MKSEADREFDAAVALERHLATTAVALFDMFKASGKPYEQIEQEMAVPVPKVGLQVDHGLPYQKGITLETLARFAHVCGHKMTVTFEAYNDPWKLLAEKLEDTSEGMVYCLFPSDKRARYARDLVYGHLDPKKISGHRRAASCFLLQGDVSVQFRTMRSNYLWRGLHPSRRLEVLLCEGATLTDEMRTDLAFYPNATVTTWYPQDVSLIG